MWTAKNQNIPRNEESVSYFERKNRSFLLVLNNGVTGDSNLQLSPHDQICPIFMLQASRIPELKLY